MFTGIVTHLGRIEAIDGEETRRFVVAVAPPLEAAVVGSSVCVQGTCLTVTRIETPEAPEATRYHFDAVPETLRKTTLGGLQPGAMVNIEGSLRAGDEMGGHWVQGHVDGVGAVAEIHEGGVEGGDWRLTIRVPPALSADLLPKGSITIDGVSLTVGEVFDGPDGDRSFNVYLIPHTLEVTTLGRLRPGDPVNLERDIMARWVGHHVERYLAARDG